MQGSIYQNFVLKVLPFIRFSTYYAKLRGKQFRPAYELLQPGDIIFSTDRAKLSTMLIPGEWSHAALVVDKGVDWEISEMTHTNYTKSHFFDFCKTSDRIAIMRCKDFDPTYIEKMIALCKTFDGAKYDADFTLGVKALYCSELVYQADFEKRLQVNLEDLAGLGRPYLSPTGLAKGKNLELIYLSDWNK